MLFFAKEFSSGNLTSSIFIKMMSQGNTDKLTHELVVAEPGGLISKSRREDKTGTEGWGGGSSQEGSLSPAYLLGGTFQERVSSPSENWYVQGSWLNRLAILFACRSVSNHQMGTSSSLLGL